MLQFINIKSYKITLNHFFTSPINAYTQETGWLVLTWRIPDSRTQFSSRLSIFACEGARGGKGALDISWKFVLKNGFFCWLSGSGYLVIWCFSKLVFCPIWHLFTIFRKIYFKNRKKSMKRLPKTINCKKTTKNTMSPQRLLTFSYRLTELT